MRVNPQLGASFSLHRCRELGLDAPAVLSSALRELGLRRFRLMSYWNIHEPRQGKYDFSELDWQLDMIAEQRGSVSLCLGKRQPRWPECHIPAWAAALPKAEWYTALYEYVRIVVERYKGHPALGSWQLENEALLRGFGHCVDGDYNPVRLEAEYRQVKSLNASHPVIMTLSDSWGLPWRRPHPDAYAMSLYRTTLNKHGRYAFSKRPPLFYRSRAGLIRTLWHRPVFIHELQAEPWLAQGITKTSLEEQVRHMRPSDLRDILHFAKRTGLQPIDLWGIEWWYWLREKYGRPEYWETIQQSLRQ